VQKVRDTPGVKSVHAARYLPRPAPAGDVKVIKGTSDASAPIDTDATHIATGVDKLRAEGLTGLGIKIGV
jgi:hypothetical protein